MEPSKTIELKNICIKHQKIDRFNLKYNNNLFTNLLFYYLPILLINQIYFFGHFNFFKLVPYLTVTFLFTFYGKFYII